MVVVVVVVVAVVMLLLLLLLLLLPTCFFDDERPNNSNLQNHQSSIKLSWTPHETLFCAGGLEGVFTPSCPPTPNTTHRHCTFTHASSSRHANPLCPPQLVLLPLPLAPHFVPG